MYGTFNFGCQNQRSLLLQSEDVPERKLRGLRSGARVTRFDEAGVSYSYLVRALQFLNVA